MFPKIGGSTDGHHPGHLGGAARYSQHMMGGVSTARLTDAVERIAVGADDRDLRSRVLEAIHGSIPFDAHAFLLTDPTTSVGCSPVAAVPDIATLPNLIRLKYLTSQNRWTELPAMGCATLWNVTGGRPERSRLWREYLSGFGIIDVASVAFTDRFGWWGFLDMWRRGTLFTSDEMIALAAVLPAITSRLRRVQAAGFRAGGVLPGHRGPGAIILSPELAIRSRTAQTEDWLTALVPPEGGRSPVPASAYNVAAQLLATEAGIDAHPAQARVHLGGGTWLTLRADRLRGPAPAEHQDIAVTMETSSPTERRDIFSRSHGLTSRESEVVGHLANGADTRTVARAMVISELTVQDHLKSVFTKTSTSSRRELLALALGG